VLFTSDVARLVSNRGVMNSDQSNTANRIRAKKVCQQTAVTDLNWNQQRQPARKQQRAATGALQAKQQN